MSEIPRWEIKIKIFALICFNSVGYLLLFASIAWEICVLLVQSREIFARCPELLRLGQTNKQTNTEIIKTVLGEELSLASTPLHDDAYARCRSHLLIVLMGDQFSAGALILREGGERRATMWQLAIEAAALDTAWSGAQ